MSRIDTRDIDARVGTAIRAERLRAGLKQAELSTELGIDRTTLSRYEAGSRSIPLGVLMQIAAVLRVPFSMLVPSTAPMELDWGGGSTPLPPAGDTIAQTLAQRPDLVPQLLEFLSLLIERDIHGLEEQ